MYANTAGRLTTQSEIRQCLRIAPLDVKAARPSAGKREMEAAYDATDYLPIYKGDGSSYTGYARRLLDSFASKSGHTFTYKALPVARLHIEFAARKTLDLKFPDNPHWSCDVKKDTKTYYSKGTVSVVESLMLLPTNKGKGNICRNRPDPKTLGFRRGLLVAAASIDSEPINSSPACSLQAFQCRNLCAPAAPEDCRKRACRRWAFATRSIGTPALAH